MLALYFIYVIIPNLRIQSEVLSRYHCGLTLNVDQLTRLPLSKPSVSTTLLKLPFRQRIFLFGGLKLS